MVRSSLVQTEMKVLITGKNGQVGAALVQQLFNYDLIPVSRHELDLSRPSDISKILHYYKPDLIINAAAYTAVDKAETEQDLAYKVNAESVYEMGLYARQNDCLLYHYSTDYIFDGKLNRPYNESDACNPLNVYGTTKLNGEQAIIASGCDYCIFRTSWVYSVDGHNFIKTILKLLPIKEELMVVVDQFGAPTSSRLIAEITSKALDKNLSSGIYHLTTSDHTTWYDLAKYAANYFYDEAMQEKIKPITSEKYPFVALRPLNSRLNTTKLEAHLKESLPSWHDELKQVFKMFK